MLVINMKDLSGWLYEPMWDADILYVQIYISHHFYCLSSSRSLDSLQNPAADFDGHDIAVEFIPTQHTQTALPRSFFFLQ